MNNLLYENASVLIIGNEILSGRTIDKNFNYIATKLDEHGISISESRTVSDIEEEIINAVNELRKRFKYVFTTGGIGPTHDDVTAASIAKAFNVELEINNEAYKVLEDYYNNLGTEFNDVRQRMARIPKGSKLIKNQISAAPGFNIENVYVFAGIPKVMQSMLDETLNGIEKKDKINKSTIMVDAPEGEIAKILEKTIKNNINVSIGSYPFYNSKDDYGVKIEISSLDNNSLIKAIDDLKVQLSKESIKYR